jgi:SNF2 family DNA or RNA helicase
MEVQAMQKQNNPSLPMPVKVTPYAHQQSAFDFACRLFGLVPSDIRSRGVALLMEMGCGKTLTAIGITGILYQFGLISRVLVVPPLSILSVWEEEFRDYADFPYTLTVLKGSSSKKRKQLEEVQGDGLQIVVVNYESARIIADDLLGYDADLIIADEAHKIKENRSKVSRAMHMLGDRASYKLLLTGTLITNKELDVFSEYRFLNSSIFGTSFYSFRNRYFDMVGYGNHIPRFRKWMTDDFLRRLHSIAFRVTKAECLDLPEITEEVRPVQLEAKAQKIYDQLEQDSVAELKNGEVTAMNVLTKLLRLSQVTGGHINDDDTGEHHISTAKIEALSDVIDSVLEENRKVVVMARFVLELDDIEEMLRKKKTGYACVRGGVKDRAEEVHRFQTDPSCHVFVGQVAAAGLGITLTAASTMVFYSLDYSMSNFDQAKARIHRVGQKENCHYIYLICPGTVDGKILHSLRNKVDLARMLVDDYRKGKNPFSQE